MEIKHSIGYQSAELIQQAFYLRHAVFSDEQGFPAEIDVDQYDDTAVHVVLFDNNNPIAVLRAMDLQDGRLKIGRVAVLAEYRGKGVGRMLMDFIANYARNNHFNQLVLSAQCSAKAFYDRLGYQAEGDIYSEEGVDHIKMYLKL
ncbi:GNAT family N-acetyltransferase [Moellerella wisconsensis]|uniref:GNAT family N-acetyltransferase n=2 Tax=Moellerella wisconsensis TaxID=158849 RepID=A0ACD3Y5Q6_9GAMM|nr:GNAT family N-acetyltransferase [Moellerella wisconsensis]KLN96248.1 GNAT family acetyltransferase [Moellerella wisconsensis]UNH23640.1 GNAT family N-acetyltransferase [Moellerella wisconsensis]UNH26728.1 GNAT family N-acetyltransferase [Moellerella wisconsensis]UNH30212.1 GNAT family N-acetyltransferase [Moellerella wisconsensis]UNH38370.1 GNAT family N-acetyltransferase [Moellerella wisconsensis]